jgi:hypothetical protein
MYIYVYLYISGTIDPTPHLYDTTFYTLGGLMTTAFIAHALVKPMHQVSYYIYILMTIAFIAHTLVKPMHQVPFVRTVLTVVTYGL